MILKERDATKSRIAFLESHNTPDTDQLERQSLMQAAARLRADSTSSDACHFIDQYFADVEDWLVIHDLRIKDAKQSMQINHLLISSSLDFYIIDSRYLSNALKLNANGQCWALTSNHCTPITSPLRKLGRDIRILKSIIKNTKCLPRFIGLSPMFQVNGFILTNSSLKSHKPKNNELDTSMVIAADALFRTVWDKQESSLLRSVKRLDPATLRSVAESLLAMHTPSFSSDLMDVTLPKHLSAKALEEDTSHCASCKTPVTAYVRERSFRRMDLYQGRVLCMNCQVIEQQHHERSKSG